MLNILLIEDDDFKATSLSDYVSSIVPDAKITITTSLVGAIRSIESCCYELILIDMAIPSHPNVPGGGAPMSLLSGGCDVILELTSLNRKDPCIVITQFPEIEMSGRFYSISESVSAIKSNLGFDVIDCIEYSEGSDHWKMALKKCIEAL